tara:strand:+ start:1096 stop:1632 length:537 start_codon:yes stop_codon:yes gene_type:complete
MATSSSNKMPLLVDRPLHSFATLGGASALTDSANLNTPSPAGCVLLVDCSANDGAVIDSLSIIANEASLTATNVLVFLSTATTATSITTANSAYVAGGAVTSVSKGDRTNISLPPLSIPVPNLASPAATVASYPNEVEKKNTGLYVPSGALIYVGVDTAISSPSANSRVHVFAQGGFF